MARAATTFDPFNAIAEPKRRQLLELLAGKELTVNQIVELSQWRQPTVSKHLKVLKQVGLVHERREGRYRVYKIDANPLQPIQVWVKQFEKYWNERFDQLDEYLIKLQSQEAKDE